MKEFNFLRKLIKLVEISITEIYIKIKAGSNITKALLVKPGLRERNSMSPILSNVV